jgi:hypothetical protein
VLWVPDRLEITNTTADLYGGTTRFDYRMAPFGKPGVPARATWDVDYRGVDLSRLTDFLEVKGLRLAGSATGKNRLEWPLGKWALKTGRGEVTLQPPPGVKPMTREFQADVIARVADLPELAGPFNSHLSLGYKPVAGHIVYSLDPDWIVLDDSWAATESTYVQFQGRTAFGERSEMPFHVTSLDWQESDRVLAGIMTTFGAPTGAVPIDGNGEFDGRMLASFSKPRIEGTFRAIAFAPDVIWGRGIADVVIENSYAIVANAILTSGESEIRADGQFSLGYPRKDHGEEIDARIRLNRRPLADLRHAFQLDDYPMEGLVSGDFHLYGAYEGPFGSARWRSTRCRVRRRSSARYLIALRRQWCSPRFSGDTEEHRHGHGRGIRRLGGGLLLQCGRHSNSGRVAQDRRVPAGATVWPSPVQRQRRGHVRGAEIRRETPRRRPVRRR